MTIIFEGTPTFRGLLGDRARLATIEGRPNYWGTPKSYPKGTIGHETSDHYKPDTLSDHIWTALMLVAVGGLIWAAITGTSG